MVRVKKSEPEYISKDVKPRFEKRGYRRDRVVPNPPRSYPARYRL